MATDLPQSLREKWKPIGTKTTEGGVLMLSVTTETTVYEHGPSADQLTALHADGEIPIRSLFTIDVDIHPPLASIGATPESVFSMAAPKAVSRFVDQIEDNGLVIGDTRTTSEYERADGTTGQWTVLATEYPVDTAGETTIPVEAHVGIWPTATAYAMTGGTVPLKSPTAITDDPEIEIDDAPDRDRAVIGELMQTAGLEPDTPAADTTPADVSSASSGADEDSGT